MQNLRKKHFAIIQPTFSLAFIKSASLNKRLCDVTISSWVDRCHNQNKSFV